MKKPKKTKFLCDENIPKDTENLLRDEGYKVISVKDEFPGKDDKFLLSYASKKS